jgi:hypothetical protein
MTELTQPLVVAPEAVSTHAAEMPPAVTFSELVYAHFEWWQKLHAGHEAPRTVARYHELRDAFERRHGEIVSAYWCSHVESAAALTQKRRRLPWLAPVSRFHRESDWATQNSPEIAHELHRCDELAVRARTVLTGVRGVICMQLVMACAAHLLSLVDARAAHADPTAAADVLDRERKALDDVDDYYRNAANGQAQIVYFGGMAAVAIAVSVVATVWLAVDTTARPVAALIAGVFGAVVSVIQRINAGKFSLEYDVGRPYAFFLGGLRPLIGGAFALAISSAFLGGLLQLPVADKPEGVLAYVVVGFVAGFSERWAQDTLAAALPSGGPPDT